MTTHESQVAEGMSPVQSKADKPKAAKISNSPALPPKFPRPSLGRNASALTQLQDKIPGCDQGSNIKRKINWDMPTGASSDDMIKTSAVETSSADSGVKVSDEREDNWFFKLIIVVLFVINIYLYIYTHTHT